MKRHQNNTDRGYVRVASSGRKHFPLPVGAPLAEFAAIASQYPVYRIEVPPRSLSCADLPDRNEAGPRVRTKLLTRVAAVLQQPERLTDKFAGDLERTAVNLLVHESLDPSTRPGMRSALHPVGVGLFGKDARALVRHCAGAAENPACVLNFRQSFSPQASEGGRYEGQRATNRQQPTAGPPTQ